MSTHKLTMSWGDRLAIIDHFIPTDNQVCAVFGITQDELDTARKLRIEGTFVATPNLDVSKYGDLFMTSTIQSTSSPRGIQMNTNAVKTPVATTHTMPDVIMKPETASKPVKQPQKRGRKGDKILKALQSVPTAQVPVDMFIQQHGVSLAVLRQAKRFVTGLDPAQAQTIGKINVRQDKATKKLMIWREDV